MRCKACNIILTEKEAKLKDTNGYVDLCGDCFHASQDAVYDNEDREDDLSLAMGIVDYD